MPASATTLRTFHLAGALLAAGLSCSRPAAAHEVEADRFRRGVIVSCPRAGQIWGSPEMTRSLEEIRALGAEWIAIHPYAGVSRDGSIRHRPTAETEYLRRATELARAAGVELFWKPHLAYWGSFSWRGAIDFGDDRDAWQRFFEGYETFIVDQARFAQQAGVPLFAVGVEYERTTRFEREWRRIIAAVRQVYRGRITYAANWDSLERVPFWDAVDLIGVHAYFPLADEGTVDRRSLWEGWDAPLRQLEILSVAYGNKPVLFAEIGYARSPRAASQPWLPADQGAPEVVELRRQLIDVALERIGATAFAAGMFWWKWIPGDDLRDRDFSMKDPEARAALRRHWAAAPLTPAAGR